MFHNSRNLFRNPTTETAGNGSTVVAAAVVVVFADLTYQAVVDMKPEQQDAMMKQFCKRVTSLKNEASEVKTESKRAAVLLAGVEQRVKRGIDAGVYASTFTVGDLYKQITGEKPPGHVYTLKCAYVNYVLTGKIAEADYLGNRNNCLELAQKIADAVIELNLPGGLQHEAVSRAAAELKTRNDNEAKVLRGILASVKPAKLLTADEALEMLAEICASGNLPVCLAQMPDEIVKLNDDAQREAYISCANTIEKVELKLGEKVDAWMKAHVDAQAPVQITAGDPAANPDTEEPASEPETEETEMAEELAINE